MTSNEDVKNDELSEAQLSRAERNRKLAVAIRKSKLVPYESTAVKGSSSQEGPETDEQDVIVLDQPRESISINKQTKQSNEGLLENSTLKESGGGFLLEPEAGRSNDQCILMDDLPPVFEPERPTCQKCSKLFGASFLLDNFNHNVCDNCSDFKDEHQLISKTEAMKSYLLERNDIEQWKPILKYVKRPNKHNSSHPIQLYLQLQIEERALQKHGSEENLEKLLKDRMKRKMELKTKKFKNQMKKLRMTVRSSTFNQTTPASHTHEFGEETHDAENDLYTHTCVTCAFVEMFEKM